MSILSSITEYVNLRNVSATYAGVKKALLPAQQTEIGRWITWLSDNNLVGSVAERVISPFMKAHLSKMTSAFGFAGIVLSQRSWLYNTASSAMLQVLTQKVERPLENKEINLGVTAEQQLRFVEQRQFIHDAAVAMIAWHALKMGGALLRNPSLGGAVGILYDVGAFVTLNDVIYNNGPWTLQAKPDLQAKPEEKKD